MKAITQKLVKYPRTMHFPWSPGMSNDDKVIKSLELFEGRRVILTEKMDGENTTMYSDYIHARSLDSVNHPSRNLVKGIWAAKVAGQIENGARICGENLYAQHSIAYDALESYFYMFSYWNPDNTCANWDDTVLFSESLDLKIVPVLYDGIYSEALIKELCEQSVIDGKEGAVLRIADSFSFTDFDKAVVKYVRKGHVQTSDHWMTQEIKPNSLSLKTITELTKTWL